MNLNMKQVIAIISAVLSVLMISTAQLTDLLGAPMAKTIVTTAGLINMIMSSTNAALASQGQQIKDVLAMPGVEKINVNAQANATLAAIAVDPNVNKISPTPQAQLIVEATAKGTTT